MKQLSTKGLYLISKELAAEIMQLNVQDAVKQLGSSQGGRGRHPTFSCPLPAACACIQSVPSDICLGHTPDPVTQRH